MAPLFVHYIIAACLFGTDERVDHQQQQADADEQGGETETLDQEVIHDAAGLLGRRTSR